MATLESFNKLSKVELLDILNKALMVGNESAQRNKAMDVCWPCGFAWITIECRKNHKLSSILNEFGFRWSDYDKSYRYSGYNISSAQNMDYRSEFLGDMSSFMNDEGIPSYIATRMD